MLAGPWHVLEDRDLGVDLPEELTGEWNQILSAPGELQAGREPAGRRRPCDGELVVVDEGRQPLPQIVFDEHPGIRPRLRRVVVDADDVPPGPRAPNRWRPRQAPPTPQNRSSASRQSATSSSV